MPLIKPNIQSLPFPYFYINENYQIKMMSFVANEQFSHNGNFLNIIAEEGKTQVEFFLKESSETLLQNTPFKTPLHEEIRFYSIYKMQVEDSKNVHLFCFEQNNNYLQYKSTNLNEYQYNKKNHPSPLFSDKYVEHPTIDSFTASVVHEIRNPLTTVKGFLQLLYPELERLDKGDFAKIALDELNRIFDIIANFLNNVDSFSPNTRSKTHLAKLLHDIFVFYKSEANYHNIKLTFKPLKSDLIIPINEPQIKQVLINIIRNAIDSINECADGRQGVITIRSVTMKNSVTVIIEDNGIGINKKNLDNIFDPFYTTKSLGTGVGLSICKEIVNFYNGQIEVSSEPNKGTTFKIIFPYSNLYINNK